MVTPVTPEGWRVPIVAAQIRGVQTGTPRTLKRSLIIAPSLPSGTAATDTPINIGAGEEADEAFGIGSIAARMAKAYRKNDPNGILHVVGTGNSGTDSAGAVTWGGAATEDGEIAFYVGGQLARFPVSETDDGTDIALLAQAAVNDIDDMPVTAGAPTAGLLPFTAKNGGPQGDDIDLRVNYQSQLNPGLAVEKLPAGVTFALTTPMAGGATPPDLSTALANLGDEPYDHIMHPWTDTTTLDAIADLLNDTSGRWYWQEQLYGHSYTAFRGTAGASNTLGDARNRKEETIFPFYDSPTPLWEWVAAFVGKLAPKYNRRPTHPTKGQKVNGVLAPPKGLGRYSQLERQALYVSGMSPSIVGADNAVYTENVLITYQKLPSGAQDQAWIFAGTRHAITEVTRSLRSLVETRFADHIIINPGDFVNADVKATTVDEIAAVVNTHYVTDLGARGIVHNAAEFAGNLAVVRDTDLNPSTGDPGKVLIGYPPDLTNALNNVDIDVAFRQEYTATTEDGAAA